MIAWLAMITIIGIPLGIWIMNRLPSILTLRPRTRTWDLGQDDEGRTVVNERGREQVSVLIRGIWFLFIGWWASAGSRVRRPVKRTLFIGPRLLLGRPAAPVPTLHPAAGDPDGRRVPTG